MNQLRWAALAIAMVLTIESTRADEGVVWLRSATEAAELSAKTGKPILIYVRSQNCKFCDLMQVKVWQDPETAQTVMQKFVPLKLTLEENREAVEAMQVKGFPSTLLFSPNHEYLGRLDGYVTKDKFLAAATNVRVAADDEPAFKLR